MSLTMTLTSSVLLHFICAHPILEIQLLNHMKTGTLVVLFHVHGAPSPEMKRHRACLLSLSLRLSYLPVRIGKSLAGCTRAEGHSRYAPHLDLPLCKTVKCVCPQIAQTNRFEANWLKAWQQFQLRYSEQRFAKSSAFNVYPLHFIGQMSRFLPTGEINYSIPQCYFCFLTRQFCRLIFEN